MVFNDLVFCDKRLEADQSSSEPVLMIGRQSQSQEVLESEPPLGDEVHPLQQRLGQQGGASEGAEELVAEVEHHTRLLSLLAVQSPQAISPVVYILK